MIRKILSAKDTRLRIISRPVKTLDKKILALISDLENTLSIQKEPEGVGLAAPQVGENVRIFCINFQKTKMVVVNPKVVFAGKAEAPKGKRSRPKIMEGCLSLVNFYGNVDRPKSITIAYETLSPDRRSFIPKIETFSDFLAQIVQHEIDHLNGVLFVDKLLAQKSPLYELKPDGNWEEVELV